MQENILTDKKILYVEDDEFIAGVVTHHLMQAGAQVTHVLGGNDAIEKLSQEFFDIVLTDLVMPNGNGIDLIEFIRSNPNPRIQQLPVLVLTNMGNDDPHVIKAAALEVTGFFAKSSTPFEELVRVIACVLCIDQSCQLEELPISIIPKDVADSSMHAS